MDLTRPVIGRNISRRALKCAGVLAVALFLACPGGNVCARTRVVLLGTSGGPTWWPGSQRMGTSSALVVKDNTTNATDHIYLIDLGPGSSQRLGEAFNSGTFTNINGDIVQVGYSSFLKNVKALFFTHLHMDHTTDYPALLLCGQGAGLVAYPDGEADKRLQVYGPGTRGQLEDVYPPGRTNVAPTMNPTNPTPGAVDMTQYLLQAYAQTINNFTLESAWSDFSKLVSVHDIPFPPLPRSDYPVDPETGRSRNTAPWPNMDPILVYQDSLVTVTATLVDHFSVYPNFAYRFDTADGSVVFSGDVSYPCANLIQLAQGADILVHEVIDPVFIENLFPPPLSESAMAMKYHLETAHTAITNVGKHAAAAGVKTLVLNHIVPANTPEARLQQAQQSFAGNLIVGADLMQIDVNTPTGVQASDGTYTDKVRVTWNAAGNAMGYQVWRSVSNTIADASNMATTATTSYDDLAAATLPQTMLYYWVRAVNATGTSDFSASDCGYTAPSHAANDFDGDGKSDLAVYLDGYWAVFLMTGGVLEGCFGGPDWVPLTGDFDGDGKSDLAVYRDGYWYVCLMTGGVLEGALGGPGWTPLIGDFDGDGKSDLAVYRDGFWSIFLMTPAVLEGYFGGPDWIPVR